MEQEVHLVTVVWTRQNGDELIIWLCGYTVRLRPVRVKFSGYSPYGIYLTGGYKYRMAFVRNLFARPLRTFTQHISTNLPFFSFYSLLPVNGSVQKGYVPSGERCQCPTGLIPIQGGHCAVHRGTQPRPSQQTTHLQEGEYAIAKLCTKVLNTSLVQVCMCTYIYLSASRAVAPIEFYLCNSYNVEVT